MGQFKQLLSLNQKWVSSDLRCPAPWSPNEFLSQFHPQREKWAEDAPGPPLRRWPPPPATPLPPPSTPRAALRLLVLHWCRGARHSLQADPALASRNNPLGNTEAVTRTTEVDFDWVAFLPNVIRLWTLKSESYQASKRAEQWASRGAIFSSLRRDKFIVDRVSVNRASDSTEERGRVEYFRWRSCSSSSSGKFLLQTFNWWASWG